MIPRGSIYTTIMELGPKRPSLLWFWDPNSIIGVYMDPLGLLEFFPLKASGGLNATVRLFTQCCRLGAIHAIRDEMCLWTV